jgi:DNA-binding NarL/FixJ family response regulator
MMSDLRGRQFEPRLFDAFLDSMEEIAEIRRHIPDDEDGPSRIGVLVVDDHKIFATSLVRLLGSYPTIRVVGTAGTVAEAVTAAVAYVPDVILMDHDLPDGDGPQATLRIKALTPAVKIIMLTVRHDNDALVAAITAGCSGFVKKEQAVEDLLAAITAVNDGETVTSDVDLGPLLRGLRPTRRGLGAGLTPRERSVLSLMAAGMVNKQIAEQLHVRLNTVRNHVKNISGKLQTHSKLEAVATAVREGIIDHRGTLINDERPAPGR